jgi:hypothetical protein
MDQEASMPNYKAFDTAGYLNLREAQAQGAIAVGMYPQTNLTIAAAAEAAQLNMGLWSFYENLASDPNGGAPQGIADARQWCAVAERVGQPPSSGHYFPDDQMVPNLQVTVEYFHAAAETAINEFGRTPGFYGQTSIWEDIKGYGYGYFCHAPDGTEPPYADACIAQSRWPIDVWAPNVTILGVTCDVDTILSLDFGGWNANGRWPYLPIGGKTVFTFKDPNSQAQYLCLGKGKANCYHISPTELAECKAAGIPSLSPDAALFAWIYS